MKQPLFVLISIIKGSLDDINLIVAAFLLYL